MIQLRNRYGVCAVSGIISTICPDAFGLAVEFSAELLGEKYKGQVTLFQINGRWSPAVCDQNGPQATNDVLWIMPAAGKSAVRTILAFLVESVNEHMTGEHLDTLRKSAWHSESERRLAEFRAHRVAQRQIFKRYRAARATAVELCHAHP